MVTPAPASANICVESYSIQFYSIQASTMYIVLFLFWAIILFSKTKRVKSSSDKFKEMTTITVVNITWHKFTSRHLFTV